MLGLPSTKFLIYLESDTLNYLLPQSIPRLTLSSEMEININVAQKPTNLSFTRPVRAVLALTSSWYRVDVNDNTIC